QGLVQWIERHFSDHSEVWADVVVTGGGKRTASTFVTFDKTDITGLTAAFLHGLSREGSIDDFSLTIEVGDVTILPGGSAMVATTIAERGTITAAGGAQEARPVAFEAHSQCRHHVYRAEPDRIVLGLMACHSEANFGD